ncbi:hypothetical protein BDN72DRAFT_865523 [Pluteus cervinus]|uniref:Uncharacterized protein n=1 Tax=Pluteus cervinus TaxID=181527 RepID=A0ACD3A008_9AGAR|nr:hypothetical protein BDN72DRAFT_865523 [Pluteus cervinus]
MVQSGGDDKDKKRKERTMSTTTKEQSHKRTKRQPSPEEDEDVVAEVPSTSNKARGGGRGGGRSGGRQASTAAKGKTAAKSKKITTAQRAAAEAAAEAQRSSGSDDEAQLPKSERILAKTSIAPPPRTRPPNSKVMPKATPKPSQVRIRKSSSPDDEEMDRSEVVKGKKKVVEGKRKVVEESENDLGGYEDADASSAMSDEHKLPEMEGVEVESVVVKAKAGKKKAIAEPTTRRGDFLSFRSGDAALSSGLSNPTSGISAASSEQPTPSISPGPADVQMNSDSDDALAQVFSDQIDVDDRAYTKEELKGSSRTMGGSIGGKAVGNALNIADMIVDQPTMSGKVKIFHSMLLVIWPSFSTKLISAGQLSVVVLEATTESAAVTPSAPVATTSSTGGTKPIGIKRSKMTLMLIEKYELPPDLTNYSSEGTLHSAYSKYKAIKELMGKIEDEVAEGTEKEGKESKEEFDFKLSFILSPRFNYFG